MNEEDDLNCISNLCAGCVTKGIVLNVRSECNSSANRASPAAAALTGLAAGGAGGEAPVVVFT